ncbi:MAG: chitobiase/beta-hexosaminidase C-terminal domain-containing protein [Bacteroidales bacterium]|nr:chitobiase/beta-hexosaminidase C-terminal domain-containing protein [Bacteroidales bacterium]
MKRVVVVLLLALGVSAMAQENINLGVIPTPQRVEMRHSVPCHPRKFREVKVDTLPVDANMEQAYQLVIEPKGITLKYTSEHGLQYAWLTLQQLKTIYGDELPCCTITDWPAYRYRGWMDDQSRGPVPHAAFRKKQWETLHALKYNFCNYYTEHTLYQPEFPDLAPAYLADCKPHPDEVINLQLFAHAEKTLRIPFYQHLMDSKANFNPSVEETYSFLEKRIAAAYHRIPTSPFFIINCDETEQLGTGRAKKLVDSLGVDQVYVDFINRCYEMINTYHWDQWEGTDEVDDTVAPDAPRIVMWGDIVAKNPAMMRQLPKDMTYIMWAYEPLDSYDHLIKPFKDNGTPFWVAPSLSHSSNMNPNPYRYMKNIANLARDGWHNGAEGLMNTCWDDNGEALFDNCWHGLFWSAEMAWNPIRTDDPEEFKRREAQFNENFERLFYGIADNSALPISPIQPIAPKTQQLYKVGALENDLDIADWYTSAALMEPLLNFNPDNTSDAMSDRCDRVIKRVMALDKEIDSAANPHAHYALMRIRLTVFKSILRKMVYHQLEGKDSTMAYRLKMMKGQYWLFLTDLKREYMRLWDQENGEYERYIVCNRYDDLAREVLELDRHVFMEVLPPSDQSTPMVQLRTISGKKPIYYTLDGSEPTASSTKYEGPFPLERSATIKAICYNKYGEGVVSEQYLLSHPGMGAKITLNTPFATYKSIYSGGGEKALVDGQLGSNTTYADGHWQGYWGDSIDAVIELSPNALTQSRINAISMRFMQNTFDWVLAPTQIKVYTSADGKEWTLVADQHFDMDPRETGMRLKQYTVPLASRLAPYTFLRVVVPNPGPLPSWHPAPGQPSYLFTDEIIIK